MIIFALVDSNIAIGIRKIKEYFNGRTILVTGGAGAIGSNLVIALSSLVGDDGMKLVC